MSNLSNISVETLEKLKPYLVEVEGETKISLTKLKEFSGRTCPIYTFMNHFFNQRLNTPYTSVVTSFKNPIDGRANHCTDFEYGEKILDMLLNRRPRAARAEGVRKVSSTPVKPRVAPRPAILASSEEGADQEVWTVERLQRKLKIKDIEELEDVLKDLGLGIYKQVRGQWTLATSLRACLKGYAVSNAEDRPLLTASGFFLVQAHYDLQDPYTVYSDICPEEEVATLSATTKQPASSNLAPPIPLVAQSNQEVLQAERDIETLITKLTSTYSTSSKLPIDHSFLEESEDAA